MLKRLIYHERNLVKFYYYRWQRLRQGKPASAERLRSIIKEGETEGYRYMWALYGWLWRVENGPIEWKHVRYWLKQRAIRRRAKRIVRKGWTEAAAHSLWRLNRFAKTRRGYAKQHIYAMKNAFIELESMKRAPYPVEQQRQEMECWSCEGTGSYYGYYDEDECHKCGGTGVYRAHTLYVFRFVFGGQRYSWHQPERFVTWPVAFAEKDKVESYEVRPTQGDTYLSDTRLIYHVAILGYYLWYHNRYQFKGPVWRQSLFTAIVSDLKIYYELDGYWYGRWGKQAHRPLPVMIWMWWQRLMQNVRHLKLLWYMHTATPEDFGFEATNYDPDDDLPF